MWTSSGVAVGKPSSTPLVSDGEPHASPHRGRRFGGLIGGVSWLPACFALSGACTSAVPHRTCTAPCENDGTTTSRPVTETDAALTHQALYGSDIAPPGILEAPRDAYVTEDGVRSLLLGAGKGEIHPRPQDRVIISFTGWTAKGERYDSSSLRGGKETLAMGALMPGLVEMLRLMVEGEKRRIWIPALLAYGSSPPEGKPGGDLVVEVELYNILRTEEAPAAPPDVAAAPSDATRTASGLAYKILKRGAGKRRATALDVVKVHYTGWTSDSSIPRGEPTPLSTTGVIEGWQEALLLMSEGDKFRLWIPAALAYGEKPSTPGVPTGPLTFDVELVQIQ
jgi:FKBP-type peptidyl-prolyl cis-trans isomerase